VLSRGGGGGIALWTAAAADSCCWECCAAGPAALRALMAFSCSLDWWKEGTQAGDETGSLGSQQIFDALRAPNPRHTYRFSRVSSSFCGPKLGFVIIHAVDICRSKVLFLNLRPPDIIHTLRWPCDMNRIYTTIIYSFAARVGLLGAFKILSYYKAVQTARPCIVIINGMITHTVLLRANHVKARAAKRAI
jgi:hypothetical protein